MHETCSPLIKDRRLGANDRRKYKRRFEWYSRGTATHDQAESGHIINVSSVAGHRVWPGSTVFSATKHAVRVIFEGLRQEVKERTTILSPGTIATELPDSITEPDIAERVRNF